MLNRAVRQLSHSVFNGIDFSTLVFTDFFITIVTNYSIKYRYPRTHFQDEIYYSYCASD